MLRHPRPIHVRHFAGAALRSLTASAARGPVGIGRSLGLASQPAFSTENIAFTESNSTLNDILQFPNVPGPRMGFEQL